MSTDTTDVPQDAVTEVATKALAGGVATFSQMRSKPRRKLVFPFSTVDGDGNDLQLQVTFQALSSKEYDDLVATCPPSAKEKQQGGSFNVDSFAPALISAVSLEPKLSVEEAREIYLSPDWSGGEIASLFINAQRVCNSGLDVPFNARD